MIGSDEHGEWEVPPTHADADAGVFEDADLVALSGPARAARGKPPLKVRVEVVVVGGDEGRVLRQRRAAAMRRALLWFHDHPASVGR